MRVLPQKVRELVEGYNTGAHPLLARAEQDWAACMRAGGYDFIHRADMFDAINALIPEDGSEPSEDIKDEEIAIALADWECYDTTIEPAKKQVLDEIYATAEEYVIEPPDWLASVEEGL
jgi:hypothetical protein